MRFLFITLCVVLPLCGLAYEPVPVEQVSPFDLTEVKDITAERWWVGELDGFPHTYEFLLTEPTVLETQVMVLPDTETSNRVSLIVIKEVTRGVEEVMRKTASSEEWKEFIDQKSKLSFRESSSFSSELEPGVYRLEVSNPVNEGGYVLKLGFESSGGYFADVRAIFTLRELLGYSGWGVLLHRLVLWPLGSVLLLIGFICFYKYRRFSKS